jgi:hypothetical protein
LFLKAVYTKIKHSNSIARSKHIPSLTLADMAVGGYIMRQPDIPAYHGTSTYRDTSEDGGTRVNHHIIFNDRMACMTFHQ